MVLDLKIAPSGQTIVKPTALGPVANTDTKLLIYGLFQSGRVWHRTGWSGVAPTRRDAARWPAVPRCSVMVLLDELDKELERRGHRFCRYADDCNVYVQSRRAGERVMESLEKFLWNVSG